MDENLKFIENPAEYCAKVNVLFQQNSIEQWKTAWKAAVQELTTLASGEIGAINLLLKPMQLAFNSKDVNNKAEAFDCWAYFIEHCNKVKVSDKLWKVISRPLTTTNHSSENVLAAKLKTWNTLLDTAFVSKSEIRLEAISAALKLIYEPPPPPSALLEICGELYRKIMTTCSPFEDHINHTWSYLKNCIISLSNEESTRNLALSIWSDALKTMGEKSWKTEQFELLINVVEGLHSEQKFDLMNNLLCDLLDAFGSSPAEPSTPYLNSILRCSFRSPVDTQALRRIINTVIKIHGNPSLCISELDRVAKDKSIRDKKEIDVLWMAIISCGVEWLRNDSIDHNGSLDEKLSIVAQILLFPFDHISLFSNETEQFIGVIKHWKTCYADCVQIIPGGRFSQLVFSKLATNFVQLDVPCAVDVPDIVPENESTEEVPINHENPTSADEDSTNIKPHDLLLKRVHFLEKLLLLETPCSEQTIFRIEVPKFKIDDNVLASTHETVTANENSLDESATANSPFFCSPNLCTSPRRGRGIKKSPRKRTPTTPDSDSQPTKITRRSPRIVERSQFTIVPKECTSPGILKIAESTRRDTASSNISNIVSFAENLTNIICFDPYDPVCNENGENSFFSDGSNEDEQENDVPQNDNSCPPEPKTDTQFNEEPTNNHPTQEPVEINTEAVAPNDKLEEVPNSKPTPFPKTPEDKNGTEMENNKEVICESSENKENISVDPQLFAVNNSETFIESTPSLERMSVDEQQTKLT